MNKRIKVENLIERLNNFDFKKGTRIKFLDKVYLYDYPNLVGIYEIGKPTKREYSIFAQFDITNLHKEVEIIEESEQDIDIQAIEELEIGDVTTLDKLKINELVRAVKQLDKNIKEK